MPSDLMFIELRVGKSQQVFSTLSCALTGAPAPAPAPWGRYETSREDG